MENKQRLIIYYDKEDTFMYGFEPVPKDVFIELKFYSEHDKEWLTGQFYNLKENRNNVSTTIFQHINRNNKIGYQGLEIIYKDKSECPYDLER